MSKILLFVDDERQILKAIKRLFLETDYIVYTAEGGAEALEILENTKVDLLVADMRMPMMDGYELLQRVKLKYPETIRLILSGYADEKLILEALRNGLAKFYMFKPWDNKCLIGTLEKALAVEEVLNSESTMEAIKFIEESYKSENEKWDFKKKINEISKAFDKLDISKMKQDNILNIINSSFWKINYISIEEAKGQLNEYSIKKIYVIDTLFHYIEKLNPNIKMDEKLHHAVICNKIVDLIYKNFLRKELNEMYAIAGLAHDIGSYLINADADNAIIDVQVLSAYLLNKLEFMYPVVESALFYPSPMDDRIVNKEIVAVVHLASYYAWLLLKKSHGKNVNEKVFECLGFSQKELEKILFDTRNGICINEKISNY